MFPNVNVIELYLENLIIKASNVGNCTYLFSEYLGYAIENSSCSTEEEIGQLDLINLDSSTTLHITNATFSDFNYGLRSIISTTGGKINLNNVNFHKISLYNTI